jgi:ABC-type amino acid transport substrate-binding protein
MRVTDLKPLKMNKILSLLSLSKSDGRMTQKTSGAKNNIFSKLNNQLLVTEFVFLFLGISLSGKAGEPTTMVYIYNAPESSFDVRYDYQWEILRTALEKTKKKYGPYLMKKSKFMTEKRQAYELLNVTGELTVMYLDTKPEFENGLIGIHIPVDRNLAGYRIFLVCKDRKNDFRNINTINDLRKFTFGLGLGWIDVAILQNSGFNVVTGSSYDGLFEMLVNKRFDIFLRATVEILGEVEQRKAIMPELYIEDSVCLFYPLPMYFWFSKTEEGKRLAARAEEGMREMISDGTYDQIFDKYQQDKIEKLHLKDRKIFQIENPFLGPETPFNDKKLWFDPKTYKPVNKRPTHVLPKN